MCVCVSTGCGDCRRGGSRQPVSPRGVVDVHCVPQVALGAAVTRRRRRDINSHVVPAVVVQRSSRPGVDQQRPGRGPEGPRSPSPRGGGGSVEDVAQLAGREFDGEEDATDCADITATDQAATRPRARYQAFRLNGLHLHTQQSRTHTSQGRPSQWQITNSTQARTGRFC